MNVPKPDFLSKCKKFQKWRQNKFRNFTVECCPSSSSSSELWKIRKNSSPKLMACAYRKETSLTEDISKKASTEFEKIVITSSHRENIKLISNLFNNKENQNEIHKDSGKQLEPIFSSKFKPEKSKEENSDESFGHIFFHSTTPSDQFNVPDMLTFSTSMPKHFKTISGLSSISKEKNKEGSEFSPGSSNRNLTRLFSKNSGSKTPVNLNGTSSRTLNSSRVSNKNYDLGGGYILAVTEGRGHARGEVGIAAMDPKRPLLILCQISDGLRYINSLTKMNVFEFSEVIVPNTFIDGSFRNKLYNDIRSRFPKATLTSVQRRHFNEAIGMDLIKEFCSNDSTSVMVLLQDKFYALSATAALIKYLEFTQNVHLAPKSLKVEYQGTGDTMLIDLDTANRLELVMSLNRPDINFGSSLLGVVNHCRTKGGLRLLRANLLQPFCSLDKIESRLNCVSELINNPILFCALEAAVSNFKNAESLLNLCMHEPRQDGLRVAEFQLKYTLLLKTILEHLPVLIKSLSGAKASYFQKVLETLADPRFTVILKRIWETVMENAKTVKGSVAAHLHGCFAIKTGVNSLLDVAKKTYCEIVQDITDHVTSLRETYNLPLRISFSSNKGYHIQCNLLPESLPDEFILVQKSKSLVTCYTSDLVALDQRSQHVLNEIKLMTNVVLFELLTDIRQHIGCLFNLCEIISELDVVLSFAHVSSARNYTKPQFGVELYIVQSRHPILDVIHEGEIVPNDVFAKKGKNFTILTGPNQSGKSIYIRQVVLLQIMAQVGCYVPAKAATFKVKNMIFSRISFDDSIESNACTLIAEMKDIEYMMHNITADSLVIIDELCRGTSVEEGTNLAFAICEEILDTSAYVFLTTHYLLLTKLEEMYFNITNLHFETKLEEVKGQQIRLRFMHTLKPGPTTAESYGLKVAEFTSFPKDILLKATEISKKLTKNKKPGPKISGLLKKYQLSLRFREALMAHSPNLELQEIQPVIFDFKKEYNTLLVETLNCRRQKREQILEGVSLNSAKDNRKVKKKMKRANWKNSKKNLIRPNIFLRTLRKIEKNPEDHLKRESLIIQRLAKKILKKYISVNIRKSKNS